MAKNVLEEHRRLKFPAFPSDEEFCKLVADLAEVDAYYFGLAESAASGCRVNLDLYPLQSLEARLTKLDARADESAYKDCVLYMASMRKLAESILNK